MTDQAQATDRVGEIRARLEELGQVKWELRRDEAEVAYVADRSVTRYRHEAKAAFIANAPADIEYLLGDNTSLRHELQIERNKVDRMSATPAGKEWDEGFRAGCEMSHSLGCDAVEGQRDELKAEVERLRSLAAAAAEQGAAYREAVSQVENEMAEFDLRDLDEVTVACLFDWQRQLRAALEARDGD